MIVLFPSGRSNYSQDFTTHESLKQFKLILVKQFTPITLKNLFVENRVYLIFGLILLVVNKIATMAIPYASKYFIDDVIIDKNQELLALIILVVFSALIIQALTFFALTHLLAVKAQEKIANIRTQFFQKIIQLPLATIKRTTSGDLTSRTINDFESIRVFLGTGFVQLIGGILSILFAIALMFWINVRLSFYVIIPLVIFCAVIYFIYLRQKKAYKLRKQVRSRVLSNLVETYRNIKVLKGYQNNSYMSSIVHEEFYAIFKTIKTTLLNTNLIVSLGIIFIGLTSIIIMWMGGQMTLNNELTIGELTTLTVYLAFLVSPVYQITKIGSQFTDAKASIDRINRVVNLDNENTGTDNKPVEINGKITFKNVCYSYSKDNTTLENINLEIEPKSSLAIVGQSGVGKTTLTDLIAGFYLPDSGDIEIDKQNLRSINLEHYRRQLGFVFQETFLFNGTVRENLIIAKPTASEEEIFTALKNANAIDFVSLLKDGIDSKIGEGGNALSEGQKQRLSIARAFLSDPKILILDEATSNLDTVNQKLIAESIARLKSNRTIIIVAHRLDTIEDVDKIVLIDNKTIVEEGTHESLLAAKGKYYKLYNSLN